MAEAKPTTVKDPKPFRLCPRCGNIYDKPPSQSRTDNITSICPSCGFKEAIEAFVGKVKPRGEWKHPSPPGDPWEY